MIVIFLITYLAMLIFSLYTVFVLDDIKWIGWIIPSLLGIVLIAKQFKKINLAPMIISFGTGILLFSLLYYWDSDIEKAITPSILLATLLAVLWYTHETNEMRRTMAHQLNVSTSARLAVSVNRNDELEIINIGASSAINVKIDDVFFTETGNVVIKFPSFLYLEPGTHQTFEVKNYVDGKEVDFPFHAHLNTKYANDDFYIKISFEDILGRKKIENVRLGVSGPNLVSNDDLTSFL